LRNFSCTKRAANCKGRADRKWPLQMFGDEDPFFLNMFTLDTSRTVNVGEPLLIDRGWTLQY
jgi:hypothetical protein